MAHSSVRELGKTGVSPERMGEESLLDKDQEKETDAKWVETPNEEHLLGLVIQENHFPKAVPRWAVPFVGKHSEFSRHFRDRFHLPGAPVSRLDVIPWEENLPIPEHGRSR